MGLPNLALFKYFKYWLKYSQSHKYPRLVQESRMGLQFDFGLEFEFPITLQAIQAAELLL